MSLSSITRRFKLETQLRVALANEKAAIDALAKEMEITARLQDDNHRLSARNDGLHEAIEGISQNPEYVQAAGWWGRFAAVLGADRRKFRERVAELERQIKKLEYSTMLQCGHYDKDDCDCEELNQPWKYHL